MAAPSFPPELALTDYKDPTFQEKFVSALVEGLRELNLEVHNGNILSFEDFVGTDEVRLHKVLSQSFDNTAWPLQTKKWADKVRGVLKLDREMEDLAKLLIAEQSLPMFGRGYNYVAALEGSLSKGSGINAQ